jgi:hypothetical protein
MKEVSITVTVEQAKAIKLALDFYSRICIGQLDELEKIIRFGILPRGGLESSAERQVASNVDCDNIKNHTRALKVALGYAVNGSNGIGHSHVHLSARRAYEIERIVAKCLIEDEYPNPSFKGVNYDGVSIRLTGDPLPVATISTDVVQQGAGSGAVQ